MSMRWSLGPACALALAAWSGCAPSVADEARADRVVADASEASVVEAPREAARPSPRANRTATGGPVEVRADGLRVERVDARGGVTDVTGVLLDGDSATSLLPQGERLVLRVRLDRPRHVGAVALAGGS